MYQVYQANVSTLIRQCQRI